jgi:hypothetical protein
MQPDPFATMTAEEVCAWAQQRRIQTTLGRDVSPYRRR